MSENNPSRNYFEQVAGEWDTIRSEYFGEGVRSAAITKAYLRPEMVVADVGSGTGFIASGLAPLVSVVHVIDGSKAMLDTARRNLAKFHNIEYHEADVRQLPLSDQSVDAVFANMVLHHCPDPLASIKEMARILKPGGRLIITDSDTHNYTWMKEEMSDLWMGFERDQIRAWFADAGLVNIIVDCTGQDCCAEAQSPENSGTPESSAKISIFVAAGTRHIPMRAAVEEKYTRASSSGQCGCGSEKKQGIQSKTVATIASSECCGAADKYQDHFGVHNYSKIELNSIPQEAAEISLGCGNPIAMAGLKPGETVLDIGSGGGMDAFLASDRVGAAGNVIGVDMTPAMLEKARATAIKNSRTNVEFREGKAESLPVEDSCVDVTISNCVINLSEDKGQVFKEVFRVLKPGGRLEVSDIVTSEALPLAARQDAASWAECISGALPEAEYVDLIQQAGFEDVKVRRSNEKMIEEKVEVYSAQVSARKPLIVTNSGCGCN